MANSVSEEEIFNQYYEELEQDQLGPLWTKLRYMVTKEPAHDVEPYLWKWQTIHKHLLRSGELLPLGRDSERRVVYLQNPSLMKKRLDRLCHQHLICRNSIIASGRSGAGTPSYSIRDPVYY